MPNLTVAQKRFITRAHAEFMTAPEIREALRERWGLEVPLQQIEYYNPISTTCGEPGQIWRDFFWECRRAVHQAVARAPLAQQVVRVRRLEYMYRYWAEQLSSDDIPTEHKIRITKLLIDILGQAAKEVGDIQERAGDVNLFMRVEELKGWDRDENGELPPGKFVEILKLLPPPSAAGDGSGAIIEAGGVDSPHDG